MINCEGREAVANQTLPQLHAAGINPRVTRLPCRPPGWKNNNRAGTAALQAALSAACTHVLFLEDDIDVHAAALNQAIRHATHPVTYFYTHDKLNRGEALYGPTTWKLIRSGNIRAAPGYYQAHELLYLYGSQAVLMTRQAATLALNVLQRGIDATDSSLQRAWIEHGTPVRIALPHPVQHRNDRTLRHHQSVRGAAQKYSLSHQHAHAWTHYTGGNHGPHAPQSTP